ncbi:MAG: 3-hydroxy-3-methylglutaryl-CoA reductase, partial [Thermoplasmataceae archaeon]
MGAKSSSISGFYKMGIRERRSFVSEFSGLTSQENEILQKTGSLDIEVADKLIENVISTLEIPVGVAVNFLINGKDFLIPMAIEEASV